MNEITREDQGVPLRPTRGLRSRRAKVVLANDLLYGSIPGWFKRRLVPFRAPSWRRRKAAPNPALLDRK